MARDKERCAWKRGSLFDIAFETAMGLKTHVPLVKKGNVSLRTFDEKGWRRVNGVRSETRPSFFFFLSFFIICRLYYENREVILSIRPRKDIIKFRSSKNSSSFETFSKWLTDRRRVLWSSRIKFRTECRSLHGC